MRPENNRSPYYMRILGPSFFSSLAFADHSVFPLRGRGGARAVLPEDGGFDGEDDAGPATGHHQAEQHRASDASDRAKRGVCVGGVLLSVFLRRPHCCLVVKGAYMS